MSTLTPNVAKSIDNTVPDALRAAMSGTVLTPQDAGYDEARRIWNAMIDKRPAIIARCATATDVQHAVAFAREHNLVVSVRGGGHNIAGLALCDGGITIDLSLMRQILVDAETRTVVAD